MADQDIEREVRALARGICSRRADVATAATARLRELGPAALEPMLAVVVRQRNRGVVFHFGVLAIYLALLLHGHGMLALTGSTLLLWLSAVLRAQQRRQVVAGVAGAFGKDALGPLIRLCSIDVTAVYSAQVAQACWRRLTSRRPGIGEGPNTADHEASSDQRLIGGAANGRVAGRLRSLNSADAAAYQPLASLLWTVDRRDWSLLSGPERRDLRCCLTSGSPEVAKAVVHALHHVGDCAADIAALQMLTRSHFYVQHSLDPAIRDAAAKAIEAIRTRMASPGAVLLRPAPAPDDPGATLLRPAPSGASPRTSTLLRPALEPEGGESAPAGAHVEPITREPAPADAQVTQAHV